MPVAPNQLSHVHQNLHWRFHAVPCAKIRFAESELASAVAIGLF
jgi:hypothetical protein